jgi:hypothetical protein
MDKLMDNKVLLAKRRDRAIASILSFKEQECDSFLPSEVSSQLRKKILDQINDLCDLSFDLIEKDNIIWNDEFLSRLDDIYEKVNEITNI